MSRQRAFGVGVLAALFATVPDVDMIYAVQGLTVGGGPFAVADSFWAASTLVHRGATHSLVVGGFAALCVAVLSRHPLAAAVGLGGLIPVTTVAAGWVAGVMMALFVGLTLVVAMMGYRFGFPARVVGGTAALGLLTHPFGDLLTGTPPPLLFPIETVVVHGRVMPFADPTLNLLSAFGVELAVIWAAVVVFGHLVDRSVWAAIDQRALVGVVYGGAAVVVAPPTMDVSYHFVFSVLALGIVGVAPTDRQWRVPATWTVLVTGLATISIGATAYAATYLFLAG